MSNPNNFNDDPAQRQPSAETAQALGGLVTGEAEQQDSISKELPIDAFRSQILAARQENDITVIEGETGSGKTLRTAQMLVDAGVQTLMLMPTRPSVASAANNIRNDLTARLGHNNGYSVGQWTRQKKVGDKDSPIIVMTDGMFETAFEMAKSSTHPINIVLDEAHIRSNNVEIISGMMRDFDTEKYPLVKFTQMSATFDSEAVVAHASEGGKKANVLKIPGRSHAIEYREVPNIVTASLEGLRAGENSIMFIKGEQASKTMAEHYRRLADTVPGGLTVIEFNGSMTEEEQAKIYDKTAGVKMIVSTNVGETSLTVDVTNVYDCGMKLEEWAENGARVLLTKPISFAESMQRGGRAGRMSPGFYYTGPNPLIPGEAELYVPLAKRDKYPVPEIQRTIVTDLVLKVAKLGYDTETFPFFNQPNIAEVVDAKERLTTLGALTPDVRLTDVGKAMEKLQLDAHYSRMVVEAKNYSNEVRTMVATMVALQDKRGILKSAPKGMTEGWRSMIATPKINDSELIKHLEIYIAAQNLRPVTRRTSTQDEKDAFNEEMSDYKKMLVDRNLKVKDVLSVDQNVTSIRQSEGFSELPLTMPDDTQREQIMKCIVAGLVDNVYMRPATNQKLYQNAKGNNRVADDKSLIVARKRILGLPYDRQTPDGRTLRTVTSVTNLPSLKTLHEVAPHLYDYHEGFVFNHYSDMVQYVRTLSYKVGEGTKEITETEDTQPSKERQAFLAAEVMNEAADADALRMLDDDPDEFDRIVDVLADMIPPRTDRMQEARKYLLPALQKSRLSHP